MFRKIETKVLVIFILNVVLWVSLLGVIFYFVASRSLEAQVDSSLKSTASVLASQWDGNLLAAFRPGMESSALYRSLEEKLHLLQNRTQVESITIATRDRTNILSSENSVRIGQPVPRLDLIREEVAEALQGHVSASRLVTVNGHQYKSAVAPIYSGHDIVAILTVEMSPAYLSYLRSFRNSLLILFAFSLLGCVLSARLFSRSITGPISAMVQRVREIGEAQYERPLEIQGSNELALLAESIETMRKNILHRDMQMRMMLNGIAHEIRNPLGGMELFAGILEKEKLNPTELEYVRKIKSEIQNLKRLLNEFLEFAGPKKILLEEFAFSAVAEEIQGMLAQDLSEKNIQWRIVLKGQDQVCADRSRLKQALFNVYKNAIQAVPVNGEIRTDIQKEEHHTSIVVGNTQQKELSAEILERIFDPFYTTREKGIGLGLPMAKQVLEAHGGELFVSENTDSWIAFQLRLPDRNVEAMVLSVSEATSRPAAIPATRGESA